VSELRLGEVDRGYWIRLHSGRRFYLADPRPNDITIFDIAHSLARVCRFGGHSPKFYSVAEHSVYVSERCDKADAWLGLLHDAPEAYIGDIVRPLKRLLPQIKQIEGRILGDILARFDLPLFLSPSVLRADEDVLISEAVHFFGRQIVNEWSLCSGTPIEGFAPKCMPPEEAEAFFIDRFVELVADRHGFVDGAHNSAITNENSPDTAEGAEAAKLLSDKSGGRGTRTPKRLPAPHFECCTQILPDQESSGNSRKTQVEATPGEECAEPPSGELRPDPAHNSAISPFGVVCERCSDPTVPLQQCVHCGALLCGTCFAMPCEFDPASPAYRGPDYEGEKC
jgi:hypothetical protein